MAKEEGKIKLFESDEEAVEDDIHDDFKIRPEYQGPHGLQMLEINSQLSKRFRLDERFAEDFEPDDFKKIEEENTKSSEVHEEKKKNLQILESILGHEVSKPVKPVDKSFSKKQLIRFDPEDENASKFIKTPEIVIEKTKKSKKKKDKVEEKLEDAIPISTERYIEVDPNLKDILSSSTPFSFSQRFNFEHKEAILDSKNSTSDFIDEMEIQDIEEPKQNKILPVKQFPRFGNSVPKSKYDKFFISGDDPRLKEGVEFFKRPRPLEELRVEWQKRREKILELFRRKKRSSQRSHTTKVKTIQMKTMIRKGNNKR